MLMIDLNHCFLITWWICSSSNFAANSLSMSPVDVLMTLSQRVLYLHSQGPFLVHRKVREILVPLATVSLVITFTSFSFVSNVINLSSMIGSQVLGCMPCCQSYLWKKYRQFINRNISYNFFYVIGRKALRVRVTFVSVTFEKSKRCATKQSPSDFLVRYSNLKFYYIIGYSLLRSEETFLSYWLMSLMHASWICIFLLIQEYLKCCKISANF